MSEFPGLRRIVKIRDFEPYLRAETADSTYKKSMKCLNLHTLQINLKYGGHSSDPHVMTGHSSNHGRMARTNTDI